MAIPKFTGGITSIRNLSYRLRRYKDILDRRLKQWLNENGELIVSIIRDKQLYEEGIDGRGKSLGHYSLNTLKYKREKGQVTSHITFKDKGKFYESLYPVLSSEGFFVWSNERITDWVREAAILKAKYGDSILELSRENLNLLIAENLKPFLQEKFRRYLLYGEDY